MQLHKVKKTPAPKGTRVVTRGTTLIGARKLPLSADNACPHVLLLIGLPFREKPQKCRSQVITEKCFQPWHLFSGRVGLVTGLHRRFKFVSYHTEEILTCQAKIAQSRLFLSLSAFFAGSVPSTSSAASILRIASCRSKVL